MIIMINGSFGVGKTTTANSLLEHFPGSSLFDPEEVGFTLPKLPGVSDFQDNPIWKEKVVEAIREIHSSEKTLIIPMTIHREENFDYITDHLKDIDPNFHHFTLLAPLDIVKSRIVKRKDNPTTLFYNKELPTCVEKLQNDKYAKHIETDSRSTEEITQTIYDLIYQKTTH